MFEFIVIIGLIIAVIVLFIVYLSVSSENDSHKDQLEKLRSKVLTLELDLGKYKMNYDYYYITRDAAAGMMNSICHEHTHTIRKEIDKRLMESNVYDRHQKESVWKEINKLKETLNNQHNSVQGLVKSFAEAVIEDFDACIDRFNKIEKKSLAKAPKKRK